VGEHVGHEVEGAARVSKVSAGSSSRPSLGR